MIKPTPRQLDVLRAIVAHIRDQGFPPTYREICIALGISLKSQNTVYEHLRRLQDKGLVELPQKHISRGIRVTAEGRQCISPGREPRPWLAERVIEHLGFGA